jgi:hypothetical protein
VGTQAAYSSQTGVDNTAIGYQAAFYNVSGTRVTAVGHRAGLNTTGSYNTFVGAYSGVTNGSGTNNTFVGDFYGNLTTGGSNTFVGQGSGQTTSSGVQNAFFGYNAGYSVTTGSNNVIVGAYTGAAAPISVTGSNWIVLSDGAGNVRQAMDATSVQSLTGASVTYSPAPAATISAATTLTNAQLLPQIVVTSGTSFTLTMPVGATLETLVAWAGVNLGFDFSLINTASGTITLDATETGVTSVGTMTVLTGISACFRIRRTAANTFIVYRV